MNNITYVTDTWLVRCVVSTATKQAQKMIQAAAQVGVKGVIGYGAKGYGARERLGALGIAVETEKDVLTMLVSDEQRDAVVEAMYKAGGLDRPGAGFIYVTPIERLATYIPESIKSKLREAGKMKEAL